MTQEWIDLLRSRVVDPSVKEVVVPESGTAEYLALIDKYPHDPDFLSYHVLFKMMDLDPAKATMAIPFLRRDKYYSVPGIDKKRFNVEDNPDLPEIELVITDVRESLPVADESVDLLVLNHGVILSEMPEMDRYLDHVKRVMKPGGIVIVVDSKYEVERFPDYCAAELGADKLHFQVPGNVLAAMRDKTGKEGAVKFEDYFPKPDYEDVKFCFLQMVKN